MYLSIYLSISIYQSIYLSIYIQLLLFLSFVISAYLLFVLASLYFLLLLDHVNFNVNLYDLLILFLLVLSLLVLSLLVSFSLVLYFSYSSCSYSSCIVLTRLVLIRLVLFLLVLFLRADFTFFIPVKVLIVMRCNINIFSRMPVTMIFFLFSVTEFSYLIRFEINKYSCSEYFDLFTIFLFLFLFLFFYFFLGAFFRLLILSL